MPDDEAAKREAMGRWGSGSTEAQGAYSPMVAEGLPRGNCRKFQQVPAPFLPSQTKQLIGLHLDLSRIPSRAWFDVAATTRISAGSLTPRRCRAIFSAACSHGVRNRGQKGQCVCVAFRRITNATSACPPIPPSTADRVQVFVPIAHADLLFGCPRLAGSRTCASCVAAPSQHRRTETSRAQPTLSRSSRRSGGAHTRSQATASTSGSAARTSPISAAQRRHSRPKMSPMGHTPDLLLFDWGHHRPLAHRAGQALHIEAPWRRARRAWLMDAAERPLLP